MAIEDILVLNDYGLTERSRTTKSGTIKRRYTVSIKAEPIVHNLDPVALGRGPAVAIAEFIRGRIEAITAVASQATLKSRASAQRSHGAREVRRYTGGKIGPMEPNRTDRLFHDSGRLIRSITAAVAGDKYVVNVAANRFDPRTLNGGTAALLTIVTKLREHVPELGDADALMNALPIRRAVKDATAAMFKKLDDSHTKSSLAAIKQIFDIGRRISDIAESIAG